MFFSYLKRSDWRVLRVALVGFVVVALALAWGLTLQRLEGEKDMAVDVARMQQNNLAIIVSENFEQLLDSARTLAIAATDWWATDSQILSDRLIAMLATNPAFLRISLFNEQNQRIYSSSSAPESPAVLEALRQAFAKLDPRDASGVILPDVTMPPGMTSQKPLLVPVAGQAGAPQCMLLVMLDLEHLLKVYRHVDFGASGVIHILTHDAREVGEWRSEGLVLPRGEARQFDMFATQTAPKGAMQTSLFRDGRRYLSSFRRAERFPFQVVVSRRMDDILATHTTARTHSLTELTILSLLIAAGAWLIAKGIGRHGRLFGALVASNDRNRALIARLEEEKRRAYMLAAHDHLTGLPNRRTFNELATSHLANARRHRGYYALMYLDLDRFKAVNDTLGHHIGDLLLQTVATRLKTCLREADIVARLGGDEFAILLSVASPDHLNHVAEKIISRVSEPMASPDGDEIQVSPSIGISVSPRDGQDYETLSKNADAAMYESKRNGRNTYTYYHSTMSTCNERRSHLERALPKAIANDEFVLHYQPKIRLSDFRIVGFEALIRWQHPEFGLIYPNEFIPLAEESQLIVELGEWVTRTCCRQLAQWRDAGLECVPVAINMSAKQLQQESVPECVQAQLHAYALPASILSIEITETVLLESLETASKVLRTLEAMGAQIALDDFGSGFSGLGYVRTLPIHVLKIDKQFIRDIRNIPHDAVLVASIISLAHNLGMKVVAEGVETHEQLIYLKTAGCDQAQGYYFSRPVPADDARALLCDGVVMPTAAA